MLFKHTAPELTAEQSEQLAARDIRVVDGRAAGLEIEDDQLGGVRLADGTVVGCQALVVGPWMAARSEVLASLGVAALPHPMGMGEFIAADPTGQTSVPGVWVAGNITDLAATVIGAAAEGATAGAAINADLVAEDTRRAVTARREREVEALEPAPLV